MARASASPSCGAVIVARQRNSKQPLRIGDEKRRRPRRRALVEVVGRARRSRPAEHGRHRRPDRRSRCRRRQSNAAASWLSCSAPASMPRTKAGATVPRRAIGVAEVALLSLFHCLCAFWKNCRELHLAYFARNWVCFAGGDFGRRRMQRFPDRWRPRGYEPSRITFHPRASRTATAVAARAHGHRIRTFWDGDENHPLHPEAFHTAVPWLRHGGLLASC